MANRSTGLPARSRIGRPRDARAPCADAATAAADPFEQAKALFAEAASPTPKRCWWLLGEDNTNAGR
jgi:hypothetical protein